jgi:hypothetical protein
METTTSIRNIRSDLRGDVEVEKDRDVLVAAWIGKG